MEDQPKRTPILWILGIITMISAFFSAFAYVFWAIVPEFTLKSVEETKVLSPEQVEQILSLYTSISSWQFMLLVLVEIMLFAGAFLMLVKLNKAGFHVYTTGKIVEFCVLNFIIGGIVAMNVNGIITSILWVLMYATQLRYMGPYDNQDDSLKQQMNTNDNSQSHE